MLPHRAYLISGYSLLLIGAVILLNSFQGITGLVIIEDVDLKAGYLAGIWFIIASLVILFTERIHVQGPLEIFISNKALERARRDRTVRNDIKRYMHEIQMIAANPSARPQEILGEFHVSPRGRAMRGSRVAWHYDRATNRLYVDDLLYKEKENQYVDDWARKAAHKRITKKDYERSGFQPITDL